jgi:hypothetical protein
MVIEGRGQMKFLNGYRVRNHFLKFDRVIAT